MDNEQYSEDLFPDSEGFDAAKTPKEASQVEKSPIKENEIETTSPVLGEDQETPDFFQNTDKVPETETFEEPLRIPESYDETPDIVSENKNDEEMLEEEDETEDNQMDIDTPDLDLEGDEDVVEETNADDTPVLKPMELKQADFTSDKKKQTGKVEKQPTESKLINLPLGRVKNIMKLDPDVRLMSAEAIFAVTKATELFIESLAKECMVHKDPKKKTIQKRDFDQVLASTDSLAFLEGAMDF